MNKHNSSEGGLGSIFKEKIESFITMIRSQSHEAAINLILFGGIGFLSGFVCKKYASYVVVGLALVLGVFLLQQQGVLDVSINWDRVGNLFGIQQVHMTSGDDFFSMALEAIRLNAALSLSFVIGFLIGCKLG